jgi:hypothetical protein
MENFVNEWQIEVPSWQVQDGVFPEVRLGDRISCGLELMGSLAIDKRVEGLCRAQWLRGAKYAAQGIVLGACDCGFALGFGGMTVHYHDGGLKAGLRVGANYGSDRAVLRACDHDPSLTEGQPLGVYDWEVAAIRRLERLATSDNSEDEYCEVTATDAWTDSDGSAIYLLGLRRVI